MDKPVVVIGVPSHDGTMCLGGANALIDAATCGIDVGFQFLTGSFLTKSFNELLCNALNNREKYGFTHFLLLHADIAVKTRNWVGKMLELMDANQADVISAVSPIKSDLGVTSTGIELGDPFPIKRFTMKELSEMSKTFTHEKIMINTGVMLVDIRKPWIEKARFTIEDEILKKDGVFSPRSLSEDWHFSRMARGLGAKLFATTEIELDHWGVKSFSNQGVWGTVAKEVGPNG